MFSGFGTVTKLAMAGDTTVHQARFAFVEFSTVAEAHMALAMNGTVVGERYLFCFFCFFLFICRRFSGCSRV
jgi:hypothetical protein